MKEQQIRRYNWVDVREYAREIFWNYDYELSWAEDMWNILMFNSPVDSSVVATSRLADEDIGDILIWLTAMYDLYFDYKVHIDHESETDETINEFLYRIDYWERYVYRYLYDKIHIDDLTFDNLEYEPSDFDNNEDYEEYVEAQLSSFNSQSPSYKVLNSEIEARRDYIIERIEKYFKDSFCILKFMAGYHYCEKYFKCEDKVNQINKDFSDRMQVIQSKINANSDREKIFILEEEKRILKNEWEEQLDELESELPISLRGLEIMSFEDALIGDIPYTYNWIESGMYRL